ncbi:MULTISPECIES: LysR family transcriptional regulator [Stenotrophomonas maltophilia group]|uniref:LysR family transcriptional regulator n=1 Tax=Stenotrophomonas maltophilia group TaxID=995085 RepID=UPI0015DF3ED0|nr:LysR family transcriptional regulator [Stenotrophomonas sepilia]MBA0398634.1 LysR family transcriptional regulator [Stenotrophomonas maltophilia]
MFIADIRRCDLNDLFYFAMVVEHGGFSQAGRALAMPKSKLSRRIALLEERLGVRLIQRSTRRFSVTDVGQDYYRHCKAMLVEAEAAEEAIAMSRAEPRGTIRLACPIAILHARIGAMLADFLALYPQVTVQLEATNRRVDVVGEGMDVAIRVRPPPLEDSDLVVRVLARRVWCTSASPALLQRLGTPQVPADLAMMPTVDLASPSQQHAWEYAGPGEVLASVHHRPRLVSDDMIALRTAAVAGVGLLMLPRMMITDELASGALVPVLQDWVPKHGIVHAVFPSRRGLLPAVRALIDYLAEQFDALQEP